MKKLRSNRWGWGFHVDLDGNLRDVFPPPTEKAAEEPRRKSGLVHPVRHVKKRLRPALCTH